MSDSRKLYESMLKGVKPQTIIKGLAYTDPLPQQAKMGNSSISDLKVGNSSIVKIAIGSTLVYDSTAQGGGGSSSPMTQSQTGGYSWLGDGSVSNKFRLTGQGANPRMRGDSHSPYHAGWNSSNAPKWTINTAGTLNVSRTGWDSPDDEEDHQIYKNGSFALTIEYNTTSTSTLSVAVNDVIEYRGGQFGSYTSDTYIVNPEFWVS